MAELEAAASVADVLPGGETSVIEEPIETGEQVAEPETQETPEDGERQEQVQDDAGDGRVLSPEMRSHLKALKATNPKLEKQIRGMAFALNNLKETFPGGTKEAIQLRAQLQEFGGLEGIQQIKEGSAKLAAIDAQIEKGDPGVIDNIADMLPAEAYPAYCGKFLETFGAKDPEGYQRMMSGVIASTFNQAGLPHMLSRISDAIEFGKPERALEILKSVSTWANEFSAIASKKPEPKAVDPREAQISEREQALQNKEIEQFKTSVSNEIGTWSKSRVQKEVEPFLKGRKLNDEQFNALESRSLTKVRTALSADKEFVKNYQNLFSAKDREGLLKLVKAGTDKYLPNAVKESHRFLFADFGQKPNDAKPNGDKSPVKPPVNPGFVKVSGPPTPDQVDRTKTNHSMLFHSQAILKDGRKVTWA